MNQTLYHLAITTNVPARCESPLTPQSDDNDHLFWEKFQDLEFNIPDIFTIDTNFDPSHVDNKKISYSQDDEGLRIKFTEAQRKLAENAVNPIDLPDLKTKVSDLLYIFLLYYLVFYFIATESA